ncbi:MAG: YbaB/EbfC family nucleoid-associated protein [Sphaerochaeta sp.]|jgi:DNA-binding YbaB/EbfC family protein|nr:YbaB/EbfC family nucleoid-associated protein [Sphaerochaeta sp.]MCI2104364.1 YbaB/EbfC family nucleoid-associated protein [Sphaerochaeta sp.]MCI2128288.1 YbaB/EbfC family nucleoid-associated protein [Sphaerochaeta sp.]
MTNPFDLLNNMGAWQSKMQQLQDTVKNTTATGTAGAGMVQVTVNGLGNVYEVKIDPSLMTADNTHTLEVLFAAASNDAITKVQDLLKAKGSSMFMGMNQ